MRANFSDILVLNQSNIKWSWYFDVSWVDFLPNFIDTVIHHIKYGREYDAMKAQSYDTYCYLRTTRAEVAQLLYSDTDAEQWEEGIQLYMLPI